jgi:DNA-binding response OmpR family regulator
MKEGKKILIIEDEKDLLLLVFNALRREGFSVIGAKDGPQGLRLVQDEKPDLVILDLDLPGINGLTLLKKMREEEEFKDTAVIVFSNSADTGDISAAMELGVLFYLTKSDWELEDIVKKIKEALNVS